MRMRADTISGRSTPRSLQAGATLIVGLVLLLVLTVIGISGMNTARMEVTMAGNTQFQQDAFQMAEDGIDVVIGTRNYSTDIDRLVDWTGNANYDRRAFTQYRGTTTVPDRAYSVEVAAFHFDVTSVGRGARNATSTHTQGFYVVGRAID